MDEKGPRIGNNTHAKLKHKKNREQSSLAQPTEREKKGESQFAISRKRKRIEER